MHSIESELAFELLGESRVSFCRRQRQRLLSRGNRLVEASRFRVGRRQDSQQGRIGCSQEDQSHERNSGRDQLEAVVGFRRFHRLGALYFGAGLMLIHGPIKYPPILHHFAPTIPLPAKRQSELSADYADFTASQRRREFIEVSSSPKICVICGRLFLP